jgi:hypothetical protein
MKKKFNLASTDEISKAQLDQIVRGVAAPAKESALLAKQNLNKEIKKEMKNAKKRTK